MIVIGIDPGTVQSGSVSYRPKDITSLSGITVKKGVLDAGVEPNDALLSNVRHGSYDVLAIEMMSSYGQRVGVEVMETLVWIGRFEEAALARGKKVVKITRKEVVAHLVNGKGDDAAIRRVLMDRFGETGKVAKGPLKGVTSHPMQALAVVMTYLDKEEAA